MTFQISENEYKYGKSDYARQLRATYGENGYKEYSAKINSIMAAEQEKAAKKAQELAQEHTNPLKQTNQDRINYLENALNRAVADNIKARREYRNLKTHLSGMLKITGVQQEDLAIKQRVAGETDMNEDLLRSSLLDAYHSQGMYFNA